MDKLQELPRSRGSRDLCEAVCPHCGSADGDFALRFPSVPVVVNAACASAEEAFHAPRTYIDLVSCPSCQLLWNASFNDGTVRYTATYGNALHYSDSFCRFTKKIVQGLARRYSLKDGLAVEIGCGDGYFLDLLCREAGCRGIGIDPSLTEDDRKGLRSRNVELLTEYFDDQEFLSEARLVSCRQVLEHFPNPMKLLKQVRSAMGSGGGAVFFEVPNAQFMVEEDRFWDVIHEHCVYLSPHALRSMFLTAGFTPTRVEATFGNQYASVEAIADRQAKHRFDEDEDAMSTELWRDAVKRFSASYHSTTARWSEFLEDCRLRNKRVVIWGAGAKSIMFLNLLECDPLTVPYAIDISPVKRGNYVSGTGQQIVSPEILKTYQPDYVLLMNENYRDEVADRLRDFPGVELLSV
jgi:SAM-dependent methyltransferase